MVRPSSKASLEAAASSTPSEGSHPPFGTGSLGSVQDATQKIVSNGRDDGEEGTRSRGGSAEGVRGRTDAACHSQTQLSGRFLLVITSTFPAARDIGIAQQTTRGVDRPLLLELLLMASAKGESTVGGVGGREGRRMTELERL